MTIGIFVLNDDHQQDHLALTAGTITIYNVDAAGLFQYNSSTALFEAGSGYDSGSAIVAWNTGDGSNEEVEAVMKTVEMLSNENIDLEYSAIALHLKTGISNSSAEVRQFLDMISVEPSDVDTINLYNDAYEINSGITGAVRVGGTRNAIIHKDIPIRSGQGSGTAIQINITDEGELHEVKLKIEDVSGGGQI